MSTETTTPPKPQSPPPKFDPKAVPTPLESPHPLRYSIDGDTDYVEDLKQVINATEISPHLKAFIIEELDDIEDNAATCNLHLVDHPHGGVSLQFHLAPKHLGAAKKPEPPSQGLTPPKS